MIPRILVPQFVRPAAAQEGAAAPRRLTTALDSRTLVPAGLPVVLLDGKTSIPAYLPLEVLAERFVVPRDMPATPLETTSQIPQHVPLTVLDTRVAIPKDLQPVAVVPKGLVSWHELPEVLEPDVITTGEVNLLARPVEERVSRWQGVSRVASLVFHTALIGFMFIEPKLFPYRPPTQAELELARRQLSFVYFPPSVTEVPELPRNPAEPTSPQVRIDPRVLRQVAPPNLEPQPLPGPPERERVARDLPSAPTPQLPPVPGSQPRLEVPRESARMEVPKSPDSSSGLILPRTSPGKALEENLRDALKGGQGRTSGGFGGSIPSSPGGGGAGQAYGALQMLTPTEGVDFTNYLDRVLASVRRNWYSVIPESARLGEKGRVVLQFRIMRDGSVPYTEPYLVATSGKEPLDRAAVSSIRTSNPFEPLPPAFRGPFIELRFIFLYNLPLDYQ